MQNYRVKGPGGRPTGPDVDRLMKELVFGDDGKTVIVIPGSVITKQAVASCVGEAYGSHRYLSVLGAWRNRLYRVNNLLLEVLPDSYRVLSGDDRANLTGNLLERAARKAGKAGEIASRTSREGVTEESKRILDHVVKTGSVLKGAYEQEKRLLKFVTNEVSHTVKRG